MANIKELAKKEDRLCGGHRACPGCAAPIAVRQVLMAIDSPVVIACATGCLEVSTTIFPYTAWKVPFIHSAFENSAATISGVEAAYVSLKRQGKITKDIKLIAFGGDGGTYDIGFQSLSGTMERGHNILYVCYSNEGYMNTGVQRSSATPIGASTTTAPAGKIKPGKEQFSKDLTACIVAHNVPYVAQTIVGNWNDLVTKVKKAVAIDGPKFINILAPCRLGWIFDPSITLDIARLATDTCIWPLYEVENGNYKLNYKPKEIKPITEYIKLQGRFKHLTRPEFKHIVEQFQEHVTKNWQALLKKCEMQ